MDINKPKFLHDKNSLYPNIEEHTVDKHKIKTVRTNDEGGRFTSINKKGLITFTHEWIETDEQEAEIMDGNKCDKCGGSIRYQDASKISDNGFYHEECYEEAEDMNWLDDVIAEGDSKFYVSFDGSFWVEWGEGFYKLAIGAGEPTRLKEITEDDFTAYLLLGVNQKGAWS